HQSGSSRGEFRTIGPELARIGFHALAIDVRWGDRDRWNDVVNANAARHGTPAAMAKMDGPRMKQIRADGQGDMDAAVDRLREEGCAQGVAVWGASIHANGALELALRRRSDIAAIVSVSPGEYATDEPERMRKLVPAVEQPSLIIYGRGEN